MRLQFSDGKIHIDDEAAPEAERLYVERRAAFATDNGGDIPALPNGMVSFEADGVGRVVFYDAKQNAFPLPAGHAGIADWDSRVAATKAKRATLRAAKAAREATA